jgi:predicted unusual protein kinase regulating ubiquinone biosynthesis (AarF/ABC1/UbiB family)
MPEPADPNRRSAAVPQGRARRLLHLGRAVGEMAASAAAGGLQQLARGERPALAELMLTPANARRLAARLSAMRGAVMKVGQLMSMDGHGVLPPAFAELLGGLRDQSHVMPATQLAEVLEREYGAQWHARFRRLTFAPIAAASIGQVHRAETHDGRVLALKIQYPGVRASIDSDVANLGLLARTPGLVPPGLDVAPLLVRVREQLLRETDYAAEAAALSDYRQRLGPDPVLWVPALVPEHCTPHILATEFAAGTPVAEMAHSGAPQAQRDAVALALSRLSVREFFQMRLVQTDPNFGNYLFDSASGRIALLDFGATEPVSAQRVEDLRELGRAQKAGDRGRVQRAALAAGFIGPDDAPSQAAAIVQLMMLAGEPLRHAGPYDFGASSVVGRVFEAGHAQYRGEGYARTPPADLLFFQRKFAGTFLLCARLRARVDLGVAFGGELDEQS